MTEDDVVHWQDHLDAIMNNRPDKLPKCGFCKEGTVTATHKGRMTRLTCTACSRFIEGRFVEEQYNLDGALITTTPAVDAKKG